MASNLPAQVTGSSTDFGQRRTCRAMLMLPAPSGKPDGGRDAGGEGPVRDLGLLQHGRAGARQNSLKMNIFLRPLLKISSEIFMFFVPKSYDFPILHAIRSRCRRKLPTSAGWQVWQIIWEWDELEDIFRALMLMKVRRAAWILEHRALQLCKFKLFSSIFAPVRYNF